MVDKTERKCGAPCVINVSNGFHEVYCEKERGHAGTDHFYAGIDARLGAKARIVWSYLGVGNQYGGISSAAPLDGSRCKVWVRIPQVDRLNQGTGEGHRKRLLEHIPAVKGDQTALCCGKEVGHAGKHARKGVFGPLGIVWVMAWPINDEETVDIPSTP